MATIVEGCGRLHTQARALCAACRFTNKRVTVINSSPLFAKTVRLVGLALLASQLQVADAVGSCFGLYS
jgi:hypothetical protein